MNFDTRTVMDFIQISDELRNVLNKIILEEKSLVEKTDYFNSIVFIDSIVPLIKDQIKLFIKTQLTPMGLSVLKGTVNLNNVDYRYILENVSKF